MALKIRLARAGAKKRPYYHIVIAHNEAPRDGKFIDRVGRFDPLMAKDHAERVKLDLDKIKDWMKKGAKPTDRVARFLGQAGVLTYKPGNNPEKAKPKKKAQERAAAATEAAGAAAPAEAKTE
ncbi:MAG TPA: 30S ribosomal protein S16 [Alphaproteobacteria bacterium]|nr:30S ribosomal protein S16 [Alphaproteobacteria bacterium]